MTLEELKVYLEDQLKRAKDRLELYPSHSSWIGACKKILEMINQEEEE
jgi:hypothetical protein